MDVVRAAAALQAVPTRPLLQQPFIRCYNPLIKTRFKRNCFFDCTWSYERGHRYNFPRTHPVLYLAADSVVASAEIGPRTAGALFLPHLRIPADLMLYVTVLVTGEFLDLTDRSIRRRLSVTLAELTIPTEEWQADADTDRWSPAHLIGKCAVESGRFDGLLYPSYPAKRLLHMSGKVNAAVFMDPNAPAMEHPLSYHSTA